MHVHFEVGKPVFISFNCNFNKMYFSRKGHKQIFVYGRTRLRDGEYLLDNQFVQNMKRLAYYKLCFLRVLYFTKVLIRV